MAFYGGGHPSIHPSMCGARTHRRAADRAVPPCTRAPAPPRPALLALRHRRRAPVTALDAGWLRVEPGEGGNGSGLAGRRRPPEPSSGQSLWPRPPQGRRTRTGERRRHVGGSRTALRGNQAPYAGARHGTGSPPARDSEAPSAPCRRVLAVAQYSGQTSARIPGSRRRSYPAGNSPPCGPGA